METTQFKPGYGQMPPRKFTGHLHRVVFWVLVGILMACVFALVFGFVVKWLWLVTLVPVFGIAELTYWQSVGIVILARLIFGGFGYRKSGRDGYPGNGNGWGGNHHDFFNQMHDRFHGRNPDWQSEESVIQVPDADRKYYHEFWEKEGKQAFEDYISREKQDLTGE